MEASLRMGINTCNGINDMPDTDDVSALSDTISKRRQQVEIRPQGAQTLACHFPSASYIDDGRNRQRITDYGITAPRLYVVLFNVWGYAVCIGLTVSKCKRFRWIPLSFLALAALSSVGPQNFSAMSRRVLVSEVKKALSSNCPGINFPLDSARYSEIMKSGDIATMIETDEKMEYLYNMYPERVVREIVDTTVGFWNFGLMQMDTVAVDECGSHWIEINTKGASIIPKGFTRFENINFNCSVPLADTAFVTVSSDSVTLTIPVSEIDTAQKENGCKPLYFYGDGGVFFTNNISIDSEGKNDMNVQLSGIIFLK